MQKKRIITLSGKPGSGKSSTAQELAKLLSYTRFSSGSIVRDIAKRRGMSLGELNAIAEKDDTIDREVDEELKAMRNNDRVIVDSRLGFHWIPESFKVYLELDIEISAARIYHDIDNRMKSAEFALSVIEVEESIRTRMSSERSRYEKLYGINPYHHSHYDLIIDTARNNPMTVALMIHDAYRDWEESENWTQRIERVGHKYSYK